MLIDNKTNIYGIDFTYHLRDQVASMLVIIKNLNDVYENVKLKEINEYKGRLLSSVSHELRTPLNGNINYLETLVNSNNLISENVK